METGGKAAKDMFINSASVICFLLSTVNFFPAAS